MRSKFTREQENHCVNHNDNIRLKCYNGIAKKEGEYHSKAFLNSLPKKTGKSKLITVTNNHICKCNPRKPKQDPTSIWHLKPRYSTLSPNHVPGLLKEEINNKTVDKRV
jgi:hypothetical protein